VAIYDGDNKNQKFYNSKDWSNPKIQGNAYEKSKTLAEKAAWSYLKNLTEEEKYEMCTINPGFVIGPNLVKEEFASGEFLKKMLMFEFPGAPLIKMPTVDVREVALAHLKAV